MLSRLPPTLVGPFWLFRLSQEAEVRLTKPCDGLAVCISRYATNFRKAKLCFRAKLQHLAACLRGDQMLWTACVRRQACVVIVMCNLLLHVYHGKQSNLFWVCDVPQLYADAALRPGSRHAVVCVKSHLRRQVPTWVQVSRRLAWMHVLRTLEQLCKRSWNHMRWSWMARRIRSAWELAQGLHMSCVNITHICAAAMNAAAKTVADSPRLFMESARLASVLRCSHLPATTALNRRGVQRLQH